MSKGRGAACLLQMLFLPLCLAEEGQKTGIFGTVQCLNNYGDQARRVNCTWRRNHSLGTGPFYLRFSHSLFPEDDFICLLPASTELPGESSCSVSAGSEFTENDEYRVSLHDASSGKNLTYTVFPTYTPRLHISCDPPSDLQSNMSESKCRIQWKLPTVYENLISGFQWELAFKLTTTSWEQAQTRSFSSTETWIELEGSEFESGVNYVARLRCKISDHSYGSEWSVWSATTEWTVPPGAPLQQHPAIPPSGAVLISLALCLGVLLFLLLIFSRTKGGCCMQTPTPATFFQPLYSSHNGNFQHWIGLKEGGEWLRTGNVNPGKGGGAAAVECQPLEAISAVSIFQQLSEAEAVTQERVLPLPGVPDWHYMGSKYAVLVVEEKVPPQHRCTCEAGAQLLSRAGSLQLQGLETAAEPASPCKQSEGPCFPKQAPWEMESLSLCSEEYCTLGASSSPCGFIATERLLCLHEEKLRRVERGSPQAAQTTTGQT